MSKYLPLNLFIRQALLYPLTSPFLPPVDKVEDGHSYAAGRLEGTLEVGGPAGLPKTAQTVQYRPGDDGDLEVGLPETPPRFTDNGDGTTTDNATGLMWINDPVTAPGAPFNATMIWNAAIDNCLGLSFAGYDNWYLPNIKQLMSILDYGLNEPCINQTFFPNPVASYYLSSTTALYSTGNAWIASCFRGHVSPNNKGVGQMVRPVRLGTGAPA